MNALLQLRNISKQYPGVRALDDVSFRLEAGEIHCLVGENGAGKSTLVKILAGALPADSGDILLDGVPTQIDSPLAAQRQGIGIIYQDLKLIPALSVAENILLGHEPTRRGFIDRAQMRARAGELLAQLGEDLDLDTPAGLLGIAQQQLVEIAKAMSRKVRILAMDEPTAPLTQQEITALFAVIRRLASEGVGIIYISHRLEEVFAIGHRVTVLRDGQTVASYPITEIDRAQLIRLMVGRQLDDEYPKKELQRGREILRLEHISSDRLHDVSLTIHQGEIVGLAGLVGSGRSELARVVFGADPKTGGRIILHGEEINLKSPRDAIAAGIGLLTEDRNRLGLILSMSVKENITLAKLKALAGKLFLRLKDERVIVERFIRDLHVRPPFAEANVSTLSGGNRQKVVLARWLNTNARMMMFDEPTAGIDVGAKYEIYTIIGTLAASGIGVLVISSDLPELLGICDRIGVMCEGRLTGILSRSEATQETIMTLATQR